MECSNIKQNKVLITGGTGSFGNKVAQSFLIQGAKDVIIFSRDEKKQHEMKKKYPDFHYIIGDVRDYDVIKSSMKKVDFVFHAAALKQVPNCEEFPMEALKTNCLGAYNICKAAWETGVQKVIALSTDKAVMPVNAMGISKAMAEKIVISQSCCGPTFSCVRYGNVMGTRGSVLPLWFNQIRKGLKISITDKNMTRFLMNLEDSLSLVKQALLAAENGDILVWKAPALTMEAFAVETLKYLGKDLEGKIEEIGRRPGEKIHETLIADDELYRTEDWLEHVVIRKNSTLPTHQLKIPFASNQAQKPSNIQEMLKKAEIDMEEAL